MAIIIIIDTYSPSCDIVSLKSTPLHRIRPNGFVSELRKVEEKLSLTLHWGKEEDLVTLHLHAAGIMRIPSKLI